MSESVRWVEYPIRRDDPAREDTVYVTSIEVASCKAQDPNHVVSGVPRAEAEFWGVYARSPEAEWLADFQTETEARAYANAKAAEIGVPVIDNIGG